MEGERYQPGGLLPRPGAEYQGLWVLEEEALSQDTGAGFCAGFNQAGRGGDWQIRCLSEIVYPGGYVRRDLRQIQPGYLKETSRHCGMETLMFISSGNIRVYLALGHTDMRKAINGLSVLVEGSMQLDPFSGNLFVFTNRRRNILKILYWDRNGFCLWQKRLEKHRFRWPDSYNEVVEIEGRELSWLLEGLDTRGVKAHDRLSYTSLV